MAATHPAERELRRATHKTIKRVTHDYSVFEFNTIISGADGNVRNALIKAKERRPTDDAWHEAVRSLAADDGPGHAAFCRGTVGALR